MPGKHQKNPRPGHNPRKWRQPANGTAGHHPRHRDQQAGARATAAALGIMPPVRVPADPQHSDHRRQHLPRVAVLIRADAGNSSLQDVRIAVGAVAPTPIRATKTEALLRGKSLTAALVKEAATLAASESSPITDQRSSAEYRGWIVEALTRR